MCLCPVCAKGVAPAPGGGQRSSACAGVKGLASALAGLQRVKNPNDTKTFRSDLTLVREEHWGSFKERCALDGPKSHVQQAF